MFWHDRQMDRTDPLTHAPQGKNIHKLSFSHPSMLRELTIIQYILTGEFPVATL